MQAIDRRILRAALRLLRRPVLLLVIGLSLAQTSRGEEFSTPALEDLTPHGIEGALVICGGGSLPDSVFDRFVELAGGGRARLVVIPTASGRADDLDSEEVQRVWQDRGVDEVNVLHTRDRTVADQEEFVAPLREATAVWFLGGQQSRIAEAYVGTRVEQELSALLKRGGVIGGTSAGAAIQSRLMIASGNPKARLMQGLDLVPGGVVDQHFKVRNRHRRLERVLAEHPGYFGLGVDEGTAVVIRGRAVEVLGESTVTVCLSQSANRNAASYELAAGERADLTALRRAAIARAADIVLQEASPAEAGVSPHLLASAVAEVQRSVDRGDIHGAVLLVARHGKIVLHEAIGWRNAEDRLAIQTDTLFKMASNTKPVIATAVLQLVEQGRLDLDSPVGKYLPSWQGSSTADVTVRQLLSHTSGLRIPGVFVKPLLEASEKHPDAPSLAAEVDRFAEIGVERTPGSSFSYNNPGFQVLGRLIEVASGQPLPDYLRESIYLPLGMQDSWNHESQAPRERMSRVYTWRDGKRVLKWKPQDGPDWPFVRAAGGMISTARDYATFCQMYLNGGTYGGQRLLSPESVSEATRPQTLQAHTRSGLATRVSFYGLGWVVDRRGIYSHSGSDGTKAWVDPERELIVLVFTQSPGGNHPRERFFETVLAACDDAINTPEETPRPRLRDLGIAIGVLPPGPTNSLTDVEGVRVGHQTIVEGESVRTGVTVVTPHKGNVFLRKVPAAVHVANGFGKFVGTTQIDELGVLESPIVLTNTLSTFAAADAMVGWSLDQPGCESVRSVNPVVSECNDGYLNDIRRRVVTREDVLAALRSAHAGPVTEGCVGAGTGVRCTGWKGGIGSSSRVLPEPLGGYTVGVLVQTNFGGSLSVAGVPVGRELGRYYLQDEMTQQEHGSCIVIVATDAPLDARRLKRLARRAPLGLATAGSSISHGSGDYVLAFSTARDLRARYESSTSTEDVELLRDDRLSPLFQAVKDATEEAVINSLLQAVTTTGQQGRTVEAIDPDALLEVCRQHGVGSATRDQQTENADAGALRRSVVRTYGTPALPMELLEKVHRLEEQLPGLMEQHNVPGVSVALISDRELVWSRGYGVRCAGSDETVQPETIMEACSMSKPFFAYLLLKLAEEGRFDIDRPLVEYLGKDYLDDDPRHRSITARMTLTHTSGLPNWRKGGWRSGSPLSLAFDPGTQFRYSGEGFLMLQRALETKTGSDLDTVSRERLIEPLKLHNTRYVWDERFLACAACGHDREGNVKPDRNFYDRANAAYSLYTSAEDYAWFVVEILRADRTASHSLSAQMRKEMLTPASHRDDQEADWGLGWGLSDVNNQQHVYHSGANGSGFRCYCEFYPESGDGLVIMTNALAGDDLWKTVVADWHAGTTATR